MALNEMMFDKPDLRTPQIMESSGIAPGAIPVIFWSWRELEINKRALERLVPHGNRLDIYVVENKSHRSPEYTEWLTPLVEEGIIKKHIQFDNNIMNNALTIAVDQGLIDFTGNKVIITDGDLDPYGDEWLDQEIEVLDRNPRILGVAIDLDSVNLPLHMVGAKNWVPKGVNRGDHLEGRSGLWLLMFRTTDFLSAMETRRKSGESIKEDYFNALADKVGKKMARIHSKAYHITWDLYSAQDLKEGGVGDIYLKNRVKQYVKTETISSTYRVTQK